LQKCFLPLSVASIEQAIRLHGIFVKGNLRTLALGRVAAHPPDALASQLDKEPFDAPRPLMPAPATFMPCLPCPAPRRHLARLMVQLLRRGAQPEFFARIHAGTSV
jgi:hypothetical protein